MGKEKDTNDELRRRHEEQDAERQDSRDESFADTGAADDRGSQDERRKEGKERL